MPKPDANIEAVSFKFEDMWFIFPVFVWHKDSDHDDGGFDDELGEHGLVGGWSPCEYRLGPLL